ncbi:MAG: class I SAM-dependent methyltransferase [Propionibacteriaceae bacterium]|jgi:ubiquinone/menaquinone biosynthesis C-methylase UbiE|nr:class I SAM-dependent methyltransferase [Propionibacteriaceae bacterium]
MNANTYLSAQFGRPTGVGGRLVSLVMNRQNLPLYEAAADLLPLSDADKVLDIGCGNGFVLSMLAERSQASFVGVDISETMVKAASRRNSRWIAEGRMAIQVGNAASLPFPDAAFTRAFTINTAYFWEDPDQTMVEIRRVLANGGVFVNALYTNETLAKFSHTQTGYKHHSVRELFNSCFRAGFEVKIVSLLDSTAYGLVCQVA